MANKKYLDGAGLDHTWGKIKSYLGNSYAAKSHTHTASQITDLDSKFGVNLIEKRVVTTSGAVSIPAGTRAIAYVGIGGGGGGGGGDGVFAGTGGGGGSGGSGSGTGGAAGINASNGKPGGVGGSGEIGFLYNFVGLSISAVIGAGGGGGYSDYSGSGAGGVGGKSYVNISGSSTVPILILPDKTTLNRKGNAGGNGSSNTGGAGGTALTVLGASAGAGGKGGDKGQSGSAGQKGAIIFLFYS